MTEQNNEKKIDLFCKNKVDRETFFNRKTVRVNNKIDHETT